MSSARLLPFLVAGALLGGLAAQPPATDRDRLQGTWHVVGISSKGRDCSYNLVARDALVFAGGTVLVRLDGHAVKYDFVLDPARKPHWIDLPAAAGNAAQLGLYELDGDELKFCIGPAGEKRPGSFATGPRDRGMSFRLRRDRPGELARREQLEALEKEAGRLALPRDYEKGIGLLEKTADLSAAAYGKDSARTGLWLTALARGYAATGQYRKAAPAYTHALAIVRQAFGPDDERVEDLTAGLAAVAQRLGDLALARSLYGSALALVEKRKGPRAVETAWALHDLGALCLQVGSDKEAEDYLGRARAIFAAAGGSASRGAAQVATALGSLRQARGEYDAAEKLYRQALQAFADGPDADPVEAAVARMHLGVLFDERGQYARALPELQKSVAALTPLAARKPLELATALNDLGVVLIQVGRAAEAGAHFTVAVRLTRTALGHQAPALGQVLNNQAYAYLQVGQLAEAAACLESAEAVVTKGLGAGHPAAVGVLANLAAVRGAQGETTRSLTLFDRAAALLAGNSAGPDHPFYGRVYLQRAFYQAVRGDRAAWDSAERGLNAEQRQLRRVFRLSSEAAMHDYLITLTDSLPYVVNLAALSGGDGPVRAMTWVLRRKTALLDALCNYRAVERLAAADANLGQLVRDRRSLDRQAQTLVTDPGNRPEQLPRLLDENRQRREEVEAKLFRALATRLPQHFATEEPDVQKVRKKLPPGSALVEFIRAPKLAPHATRPEDRFPGPRYFAFVLTPGDAPPRLIDLGDASAIDRSVAAVQEHFEEVARLYGDRLLDERVQEVEWRKLGAALYAKLVAPLRPALGSATRLYLAPDGALSRLPFGALPSPDGKYLAQTRQLVYLASGRDLLRPRSELARGTTIFAGPDYNLGPQERLKRLHDLGANRPGTVVVPPAVARPAERGTRGDWQPLAGARAEASVVRDALNADKKFGPVAVFAGPDALEEVFEGRPAPRLLHLATHGFVYPAPRAAERDRFGPLGVGFDGLGTRFKHLDDPLLRSGIVLAGANTVPRKLAEPVADGWVTAARIALMDLRGTDLVVLSACDTGLGDVRVGEGVAGLRSAFQYAGARTVVMTLFAIPDRETLELMKPFYAGLKAGRSKIAALTDAQRQIIERRQARRRDDQPGPAHPFFWSAFVLVGEPE